MERLGRAAIWGGATLAAGYAGVAAVRGPWRWAAGAALVPAALLVLALLLELLDPS